MRLDALTVAGAAQVAEAEALLLALVPVSRFTPPGRKARRAPTWRTDYKRGGRRGKVMKYMQKAALLLDLA
jgi:hypothetical protein